MQLALLEQDPEITASTTSQINGQPTAVLPTLADKFAAVWKEYQSSVDRWATQRFQLSSLEQDVLHCEDYMAAIQPLSKHDVQELKSTVASRIRERIKRYAEERFAPAGGSLTIDNSDIEDRFPTHREHCIDFDPVAFWSYLENKYGGNAGEELAWRQAAQAIYSAFNLQYSKGVETKGGYAILRRHVWIDDINKKYHNRNTLSYGCQQSVRDCCHALAGFATWAERDGLVHDLNHLQRLFCGYGFDIQSRKKYECGDKGEVVVVTFTKCFEYRLREDVAAQLNLFLGTYMSNGG